MLNKEMGFNKDHLVLIRRASILDDKSQAFKDEILKINGVINASFSTAAPANNNNGNGYTMDGRDQESFLLETNWVDYDYFDTYGITLSSGRLFDKSFAGTLTKSSIPSKLIALPTFPAVVHVGPAQEAPLIVPSLSFAVSS